MHPSTLLGSDSEQKVGQMENALKSSSGNPTILLSYFAIIQLFDSELHRHKPITEEQTSMKLLYNPISYFPLRYKILTGMNQRPDQL